MPDVAAPPPPIDCLHAKARPRAAKDATARHATQDAADLGASLFVYCMHDIFLWSRAGLFKSFEIFFSTLDFFVYTMCVCWVYTCVCVCVDIYTPSLPSLHVCVCILTGMYVYMHAWQCVCVHVYMYTHWFTLCVYVLTFMQAEFTCEFVSSCIYVGQVSMSVIVFLHACIFACMQA
jgi:hypothetical protein